MSKIIIKFRIWINNHISTNNGIKLLIRTLTSKDDVATPPLDLGYGLLITSHKHVYT